MKTTRLAVALGLAGAAACLLGAGCDARTADPSPTPVSACTYAVSPGTFTVAETGGTQAVTVTASPAGCSPSAWTASTAATDVTLSPASGSGAGRVDISVARNDSVFTRTLAVTVAGQSVTVSQGPALVSCAMRYDPVAPDAPGGRSWALSAAGGTRQVRVTLTPDAPNCAEGWRTQADAFVSVTPSTGTTSALVTIQVAPNSTGAARTSEIGFAGTKCSPFCGAEFHANAVTITQSR